MTDREKLIELLRVPIYPRVDADPAEVVADYLLDNGVTFVDRPVGHWIMHDDEILGLSCECSVCHIETCGDSPYCPHCGAKMEV